MGSQYSYLINHFRVIKLNNKLNVVWTTPKSGMEKIQNISDLFHLLGLHTLKSKMEGFTIMIVPLK